MAWLVVLAALCATPASAQEIFAWFQRDLLGVRFETGDWVSYRVEEIDESGPVTDTLTVTVLAADSARVWLELAFAGRAPDYVELDPGRVVPGEPVLDALLRVVRTTEAGLVDEDVADLRSSAIVQRHFADPFRDPQISRTALADTLCHGRTLHRERVRLEEERREVAGPWVIVTRLHARAQLSSGVPLAGLLRSSTTSVVTTEAKEGRSASRRPPLVNEHELECIGFGRQLAVTLPDFPPSPAADSSPD